MDGHWFVCWSDLAGVLFPLVPPQTKKRGLLMNWKRIRQILTLVVIVAAFFIPRLTSACAVCFGDPQSPLTLGAKAGVLLLLGVVVIVLGAIVGVGFFWARRARLLEVQEILHGNGNIPE
jgi:hypothetical protein